MVSSNLKRVDGNNGEISFEHIEVHLATKAGLNGPVVWYMSVLINGTKGGKRYAEYDGKCDNWNASRDLARTYFGIWGWKMGVDGLASWTYPGARTVQWEIVREGIDDLKYLKLIERLIHGKNITPKPLKSAEAFLDEVSKSIKLTTDGYVENWKSKITPTVFHKRTANIIEQLSYE